MTCKAPKHAFDSEELAGLDRALASAWAAVETNHATATTELNEELRTDLSRLIFRLAASGIGDVEMLRDFALIARSPRVPMHRGIKDR